LPGADRMYPDTDLPPKLISKERVENIRATLPEYFWDREEWYKKINVPNENIRILSVSKFAGVFHYAVQSLFIDPKLASSIIIQYPKVLKRKRINADCFDEDTFLKIFGLIKDKLIFREGILPLMENIALNRNFKDEFIPPKVGDEEFERIFSDSFDKINKTPLRDDKNKPRLFMSLVMKQLKGRMEGKVIWKKVNELFNVFSISSSNNNVIS